MPRNKSAASIMRRKQLLICKKSNIMDCCMRDYNENNTYLSGNLIIDSCRFVA